MTARSRCICGHVFLQACPIHGEQGIQPPAAPVAAVEPDGVEKALAWADTQRIGIVGGPGGALEKIASLAAALRQSRLDTETWRELTHAREAELARLRSQAPKAPDGAEREVEALEKRARMVSACDPECEGRCRECPQDVLNDAIALARRLAGGKA